MGQVNELEFIELVRSKPILYDPILIDYRNHELRKATWDQIATKVGVTGRECKDIWTRLRNSYTNALKRRLYRPTSTKWKFEDQMSFLMPSFESRQKGSTEQVANDGNDSSETDMPYIEIGDELSNSSNSADLTQRIKVEPETYVEETFHPTSQIPPNKKSFRKRRREQLMDELMRIMQENNGVWREFMTKMALADQRNYAQDDTELFFLTMARNTKKLSLEEQAKVKMELSSAVFQAEIRDIQRPQSHPHQNPRNCSTLQVASHSVSAKREPTPTVSTKTTTLRSHTRRTWNYAQVKIMFEIWQQKMSKFRKCPRNAHVYTEMAHEMKRKGAVYTPIEIKYKIHNLTQKYRAERRLTEKSGKPSKWQLYEKVHQIIGSTIR